MDITQTRDGNRLTVGVKGKITTLTAPGLEAVLRDNLADVDDLILDISELESTSSAGLRVILEAQQIMDEKDARMIVRGANDFVMKVFRETGFDKLLDIR